MSALSIERIDAAQARIGGRLGFDEASAAFARGSELYAAPAGTIAVDISELKAVDSATLAVLLAWSARACQAGTTLRFTRAPDDLRALAHLCDAEALLGFDAAN